MVGKFSETRLRENGILFFIREIPEHVNSFHVFFHLLYFTCISTCQEQLYDKIMYVHVYTVEPHLSGHLRSQYDCPDN